MLSGVPQGSILGPLLFLLYINDLPDCLVSSTMYMFSDDFKLMYVIRNFNNTTNFQDDLNSRGVGTRGAKGHRPPLHFCRGGLAPAEIVRF